MLKVFLTSSLKCITNIMDRDMKFLGNNICILRSLSYLNQTEHE